MVAGEDVAVTVVIGIEVVVEFAEAETGADVVALDVFDVLGVLVALAELFELDEAEAALLVPEALEADVEVAAVLLLVVGDIVGAIGAAGLSTKIDTDF